MAQPTITQAHLPVAGHTYTVYTDTIGGAGFTPTAPSSSAQTWDYTNAFTVAITEQLSFVSPAGLPGASLYPMADLATTTTASGYQISAFYDNAVDGLSALGSYFELTDVFTVTNTVTDGVQFPVPLTLGTTLTQTTSSSTLVVYAPGLSLPAELQRFETTGTLTGDAYGTLSTPAWPVGVQVVRVRSQNMMEVDSSFTDASGTGNGPWVFAETNTSGMQTPSYDYYRAGVPSFVMSVNNDQTNATYYGNSVSTDIADNGSVQAAQLFPNPANGSISIVPGTNRASTLEIVDLSGRVQATYSIQGIDRVNVITEGWASGTYVYNCLDIDGVSLHRGAFLVAH